MLAGPALSGRVRLPCGCEFAACETALRAQWTCARCGRALDPEAQAVAVGTDNPSENRDLTAKVETVVDDDSHKFADTLCSALIENLLGVAEERKTLLEGAAQLQTQLRELTAENRRLREHGIADAEQAANNKRILDAVAALRRRLE